MQGALELSGKTWNHPRGWEHGRVLVRVIGRIPELRVGILEMSVISWLSLLGHLVKSFKLKLFKMEFVTKKKKNQLEAAFFYIFLFGCTGPLLLHVGFLQLSRWVNFSSQRLRLLQSTRSGPVASGVAARGLSNGDSQPLEHRLSSRGTCGIFPDQGSNPRPQHWQVDSYPEAEL